MDRKTKTYYQYCKCPKCGGKAVISWCPPGYNIVCTKCNYGIATSIFHPIYLDETIYTVNLKASEIITKDKLKLLSNITGKNYIYCKNLLRCGGFVLSGQASNINDQIDDMISLKIDLSISPEWKYYDDPVILDKSWKVKDEYNIMAKIKLGSLCKTKVDVGFDYKDENILIKKGTFVTVCDDDDIDKGHVLVEIEGYDTVFGYKLDQLTLIKNYL